MKLSEWHSRGYLPHWEAGEVAQSITFRLGDSLPTEVLDRWSEDLRSMPPQTVSLELRKRVERALDAGHGSAVLSNPAIGDIVERALLHFDGDRYRLHAWVIMPNHVHVMTTPLGGQTLAGIAHAWKSFTAKRSNALLGRDGKFWAREYFDRAIRDERHFGNAVEYIAMNPVKAGLCSYPEDWRFSSAWRGRPQALTAGVAP